MRAYELQPSGNRYEARLAHWIYAGDSHLHVAAAGYGVEIATMLLAARADFTAAGNRRCSQPLHYAADGCLDSPSWSEGRQVAMIHLLLKAGANKQIVNSEGHSARELARKGGYKALAKQL